MRDNDYYGHVNNVVYAEWIDTIIDRFLLENCSLDPLKSPLLSFVAYSYCEYFSPLSYPARISAGLFVKRIGNSSADFQVGIFENDKCLKASAVGGFAHVFVDRINQRSQKINDEMRKTTFIHIKS